jgi:hypothetical protein
MDPNEKLARALMTWEGKNVEKIYGLAYKND